MDARHRLPRSVPAYRVVAEVSAHRPSTSVALQEAVRPLGVGRNRNLCRLSACGHPLAAASLFWWTRHTGDLVDHSDHRLRVTVVSHVPGIRDYFYQ
jgi:hypothetical protein